MQFMVPEHFQSVTYEQALNFPHNLIAELSPSRIKYLRHYARLLTPDFLLAEPPKWPYPGKLAIQKEQFQAIPLEHIPDLSLEFLKALANEQVYWFTFEQLTHLNKEQLKILFSTRYSLVRNIVKIFSIMHIAEQAGNQGNQWLRGPMKEAVMKLGEEECATINLERYRCLNEEWMKFPNMPERMKRNYFSPPPDQPRPIPTKWWGLQYSCKALINRNPYNKNKQELPES